MLMFMYSSAYGSICTIMWLFCTYPYMLYALYVFMFLRIYYAYNPCLCMPIIMCTTVTHKHTDTIASVYYIH